MAIDLDARDKSPHQTEVEEFMRKAGQAIPYFPTEPDAKTRVLRARLILEEALETIQKGLAVDVTHVPGEGAVESRSNGGVGIDIDFDDLQFNISERPFDMVELADGCCDVAVVTTGTLSACGVADDNVQAEVNESNLAKFQAGHYIDDHGKLIKPPGWTPPNLLHKLQDQGYKS